MRNPEFSQTNSCDDRLIEADVRSLIQKLERMDELSIDIGAMELSNASTLFGKTGKMKWCSPKARLLLGIDADAQVHSLIDHIHVLDRVQVADFLSEDDDCTNRSKTCEFRPGYQSPNLETSWIEVSKSWISGEHSNEKFALVTLHDITEIKKNELAAELLQGKAEQANKSKTQFLANISHELRTPLNAILGFSELLNSPIMSSFSAEKQGEYISLIHDSASHLLNVLNGILDMSKIENGMYEIFPEAFDLSKCLENTTAIMRGQAAMKSVHLETYGFDELPEIIADERAVKQVMINLLSNAIKFSNENGRVLVKCERRARTVHLSVSDRGIGISPEHLDDLGKPFFQADSKYDRKYEGTGLGLSVVKGLVELHKGRLQFDSKRGLGTTVTVILPIHGNKGRQIPASSDVEKVTTLHGNSQNEEQVMRILRNTA